MFITSVEAQGVKASQDLATRFVDIFDKNNQPTFQKPWNGSDGSFTLPKFVSKTVGDSIMTVLTLATMGGVT